MKPGKECGWKQQNCQLYGQHLSPKESKCFHRTPFSDHTRSFITWWLTLFYVNVHFAFLRVCLDGIEKKFIEYSFIIGIYIVATIYICIVHFTTIYYMCMYFNLTVQTFHKYNCKSSFS